MQWSGWRRKERTIERVAELLDRIWLEVRRDHRNSVRSHLQDCQAMQMESLGTVLPQTPGAPPMFSSGRSVGG